jgi:polysaccharide export outer membrane protein
MKSVLLVPAALAIQLLCPAPALSQEVAAPSDAQHSPALPGEYVAGPQDVLDIVVFGESDVSGKFAIESDGTINFPLIGRVTAAGLGLRAIERELHARLADGYLQNPQVSVGVSQFRSQRVFIVGEVGRPGTYPLTAQMTLIEALATAGSVENGAAGHVVIVRGSRRGEDAGAHHSASEVLQIDLGTFQAGSLSENVVLRDGDVVIVPRAESVYVLGQVRNPGVFALERGTTVLQALALAGGVSERGSMSRIRVVRVVNGRKTELKVGLDDPVRAGDTVMVLERFF